MKISKKKIIYIITIALLCLGVVNIIYEIHGIRKDTVSTRVDNAEYLNQLYEAQIADIKATAGNTITVEGCDIILGKTTVQEFLNESGCSIDKSSGYYSVYDYYDYYYMTKSELNALTSIDAIGSGTVYAYQDDHNSDIHLEIASCQDAEEGNPYPSFDRCYITAVTIDITGGKDDYDFSYLGVDQNSTHRQRVAAWGDGTDAEPRYSGDYYNTYYWSTGRNVKVQETVYTKDGQDLYDAKWNIRIVYYD
jgi:hypothetical protein